MIEKGVEVFQGSKEECEMFVGYSIFSSYGKKVRAVASAPISKYMMGYFGFEMRKVGGIYDAEAVLKKEGEEQ